MNNLFDPALFNEYREGNRLEVKKASGGLRKVYGRRIPHLQTVTAE